MAPTAHKRKRPERQPSEDDGANRPSPYKPEKSGSARRTSRGDALATSQPNGQEVETVSGQHGAGEATGTPRAAMLASRDGTQTPAPAADTTTETAAEINGKGGIDKSSADLVPPVQRPPYHYIHITSDVVASWSERSSSAIVETSSSLDDVDLSDMFAELIRSALDGRLDAQAAGLVIREIIDSKDGNEQDATILFLDTVQFLFDATYKGPPLRSLLVAAGVDQQIMRGQLDHTLLIDLGLVRSTFDRIRTRKTTNLLYRQANFNLLREESEGYAKLITEYFNIAQEASSRRDEGRFMAEDAFQRVKALVGAFDLDIGRVLDITLDVSANLLVKAYPFFIKFYRASSWWPTNSTLDDIKWEDQGFSSLPSWAFPGSGRWAASDHERERSAESIAVRDTSFWNNVRKTGMNAFFEIGTRKIVDFESVLPILEVEVQPEKDSRGNESNPDKRLRLNQDKAYMRETGTLPPFGNHDAAQLLGFKLRFYASPARDASDSLPDNLIFLTALLIKIGFISLRDLYPHLYPPDSEMPAEKARLNKEKAEREEKERPGGGMNALLMAGALVDDTAPPPRRIDKDKSGGATPAQDKKDDAKDELPVPANQKILLLKALLLIGALPEALFILGRFPWLAESDLSLHPLLLRVARHMLSKVSESLQPISDRQGLQEPKEQLADTTPRVDGKLSFSARPPRRTTRWLWNDVCDKEDGLDYRHYYADWNDNIPVCQTFDDVFDLCNTFLGYLGARIGQDVVVYGTLLRLAHRSLSQDSSKENRSRWLDLMSRLLVPALSWTKHIPALAQEVFDLLNFFPTATRYNIYYEWFRGRVSRRSDMQAALLRNRFEVRDVLRRISNDYVKKQSRALAKIAVASPGMVMIEMIEQLESYSNMIPSLVECTRYFSPLAWDVLTWALVNSLSGQGRDRMQADGMLTSSWLQALSQFVASLFTRHSHISVAPILQYLASELRVGNSTDLELLEQLLVEMAGVRSDMDFNDTQVIAMAGGQTLRTYILSQLSDNRHVKQKSAARLMEALERPGLTGQVLIAIAQERQMYFSHEFSKSMPLKVLGNNIDKIQAVFYQYLEVLKTNLKPRDFEKTVPNAVSLAKDFGLEPSVALTICRTAIRGRMEEHDEARKQELEESKKETTARRSETSDDNATKEATLEAKSEGNRAVQSPGDKDPVLISQDADTHPTSENIISSPWHPVLEPIIQQLPEALPDLASRVSIPFYVTFWTLSLYDVLVPMDIYTNTVKRLEAQLAEIASDRSDLTQVALKARDNKKKNLIELRDKLRPEPTQHLSDYIFVRNRISRNERFHYFQKPGVKSSQGSKAENDAKHQALLQECFLPRAMMSSIDAQFSFQVLKMLHDNGTPGFSLMHLLHQLFRKQELTALIFQCTLNEAQNFGRLLNEVLKHLHTWHADKTTYEKEALGVKNKLPGFVKTFDGKGEPKLVMDYENFRRMLFNCHAFLNGALQSCFESAEYMHIRNGIVVLKAIHQVFPALKFIGKNMVDQVTRLSQEDPRQDLKLAAMSLLGPLKSREKQWVLPQTFRLNDPSKDGTKPASRAPSARPETPQPDAGTHQLNATAPAFTPNSATVLEAGARKQSLIGGPEDGEIEDEKPPAGSDADRDMQDAATIEKTTTEGRDAKALEKENADASQPPNPADLNKSDLKPSTPAPAHTRPAPSDPQHADSSRPPSTQPASLRRPPQDLPARPEESRTQPGPVAPRPSGRYPSRPDDQYGRLERPNDARPTSGEHSPGHRGRGRTPPAGTPRTFREERPFDRPADRMQHDSRNSRDERYVSSRHDGPIPAQTPRSHADARERPEPVSRVSEGHLHPDRQNWIESRVESVAVPTDGQQTSRPVSSSATGAQPRQQEDQVHVNPARLAMINSDTTPNGSSARRGREVPYSADRDSRYDRDIGPDDRSQTNFPQRTDAGDGRRVSGRAPAESPRETSSRPELPADLAPTGPKRGRLRETGAPQGESNYGRLNGPAEPPSGPRQPNGRGARNFTTPMSARTNEPTAPSPAASRAPEVSAAVRPSIAALPQDRHVNSSSAPSTPASEPLVHPSRAAQLGQPAPIQTNFPALNGPRHASSPTNAPPSAPRGPGRSGPPSGTPTGPAPTNGMVPSGPASAGDRQRRQERQRQSINATLQGSTNPGAVSAQGVNFRGASTRQSSGSYASAGPRSTIPSAALSMEPPQSRSEERQAFEEPGMYQPHARSDLFQSRADRTEEGGMRREDNRSDRQRASLDAGREARSDNMDASFPPPPPPVGSDDGRDRRGPRDDHRRPREERPRDSREIQQQARDGRRGPERQPRGPPTEMVGGFNAPPPEWERSNEGRGHPRRDVPHENRRGGRGGGPGRPEDFRQERRELGGRPPQIDGGPMEGARKRRHEDDPLDGSKRRRSGR